MDGSAPGPGARTTPDLKRPDGTQSPADLGADYALAVNGVQIAAPVVTKAGGSVLYRLGGRPVQLVETATGISPDGWMGNTASYTRYAVDPDVRGFLKVVFSRQAAGFSQLKPVRVGVKVGPVAVGPDRQPTIGHVTAAGTALLPAGQVAPVLVPVPPVPWRAEATVAKTFVPAELDPSLGDRRELGAVVSFEFVPLEQG